MTNEEKVALYGCSIQGYLKYFKDNNYANAKDAIDGSIKYLLRRGVDEELTDCNLNELLYVIKNEVAKMVAKEQLNSNPNDLTNMHSKDDKNVQYFLKNPNEYVGKELSNNGNKYEIDTKKIIDSDEKNFARKYNKNIKDLGRMLVIEGVQTVYNVYESNQNDDKAYNIINQLQTKLNNSIEESFERQKPSFFEKFFRRTSREYKNFKEAFNNYKDKNHPLNGADQNLKDMAMGYIRHKFPNLDPDKLPTAEQIATLGGAGKERAAFCLKVIETINEHSAVQEQAYKVNDAIKNVEIKEQDNIIANDNFQKDLQNDVDDKIIDNNLINENDNSNIISNEIENVSK